MAVFTDCMYSRVQCVSVVNGLLYSVQVNMAIAPTEETIWLDQEMKSEEKQVLENYNEPGKEWEMEHKHCEADGGREKQSELDYQTELSKDREKQRERHDISKISAQRSSKSQKVDIGRSQKAGWLNYFPLFVLS